MSERSKFLTLNWDDVEKALTAIAMKIIKSDYTPQAVIGIMRGGWIPARVLSDLLEIHGMGAVEIKFYRGIEERGERPVITQPLLLNVRDKNVLIVDDVVDTGKSLQVAINAISLHGPRAIRSAAIYTKPWSLVRPDYYYGETDKWIIFPWETREVVKEIVSAEYKTLPPSRKKLEEIAEEIAQKTGLAENKVSMILEMMVKTG